MAGAGAISLRIVVMLIVATVPPATDSKPLASACFWSSSQIATHVAFTFEREGCTSFWVCGSEERKVASEPDGALRLHRITRQLQSPNFYETYCQRPEPAVYHKSKWFVWEGNVVRVLPDSCRHVPYEFEQSRD